MYSTSTEISKSTFYGGRVTRVQRRVLGDVLPISLQGAQSDSDSEGDLDGSDADLDYHTVRAHGEFFLLISDLHGNCNKNIIEYNYFVIFSLTLL